MSGGACGSDIELPPRRIPTARLNQEADRRDGNDSEPYAPMSEFRIEPAADKYNFLDLLSGWTPRMVISVRAVWGQLFAVTTFVSLLMPPVAPGCQETLLKSSRQVTIAQY